MSDNEIASLAPTKADSAGTIELDRSLGLPTAEDQIQAHGRYPDNR
jgi:hypothetical protein